MEENDNIAIALFQIVKLDLREFCRERFEKAGEAMATWDFPRRRSVNRCQMPGNVVFATL